MIEAAALIESARALIGTPVRHQGHSPAGVDCIGLLYVAAANAGLRFEDHPNFRKVRHPGNGGPWCYPRRAHPRLLETLRLFARQCDRATPGGLIFFRFPRVAYPQHFAICAGATMIHAQDKATGVVEVSYAGRWLQYTHSFWLLDGVRYA